MDKKESPIKRWTIDLLRQKKEIDISRGELDHVDIYTKELKVDRDASKQPEPSVVNDREQIRKVMF